MDTKQDDLFKIIMKRIIEEDPEAALEMAIDANREMELMKREIELLRGSPWIMSKEGN